MVAPPSLTTTTLNADRNLYWGDLHVHTALSFDAYSMGVRSGPDDAYIYMKGGTIEHGLGYPIRAQRPLDFGAVSDHGEYLGVAQKLAGDQASANLREIMLSGNPVRITWNFLHTILSQVSSSESRNDTFGVAGMQDVSRQAWQEVIDSAERHNIPGEFSTFIAYEWTSMPEEDNLHRNIIYTTNKVPSFPFTALDSENPAALWAALDKQRE